MADNNLQNLLHQVSIINNKYKDIAEITGENFNIFSVLDLQSSEVTLHSRLIGELLNPKGSHSQGSIFLKLFLNETLKENDLKEYTEIEINNATVIIEENIGNIVDNYEKGGRIDLVIKFSNNKKEIVIENKIWAIDQPKQLLRYANKYTNAHIFYLTPFGNKPSEESLGGLSFNDENCISYHTNVKNWIIQCIKETANHPLIREILNHYLHTINYLTNQTNNNKMSKEIINTITSSEENLKSAFGIASNLNEVKYKLINIDFISQLKDICKELNLKVKFDEVEGGIAVNKAYAWFAITNVKWEFFHIRFVFEAPEAGSLTFGIAKNENISDDDFKKFLNDNPNLPDWKVFPKYPFWGVDAMIAIINTEKEMVEIFRVEIENIIEITKDLKM